MIFWQEGHRGWPSDVMVKFLCSALVARDSPVQIDPGERKGVEGWAKREALRSQQKLSCTREEEGRSCSRRNSVVAKQESENEDKYLVIFRKTLWTTPSLASEKMTAPSCRWRLPRFLVPSFHRTYLQLSQILEACSYYQGSECKDRHRNRPAKCICHLSQIVVFGT